MRHHIRDRLLAWGIQLCSPRRTFRQGSRGPERLPAARLALGGRPAGAAGGAAAPVSRAVFTCRSCRRCCVTAAVKECRVRRSVSWGPVNRTKPAATIGVTFQHIHTAGDYLKVQLTVWDRSNSQRTWAQPTSLFLRGYLQAACSRTRIAFMRNTLVGKGVQQ